MSRQVRRFRALKDDTTNPTLFKVTHSQTFLQDETVLSHVDEFINIHPLNSITGNTSEGTSLNSEYTGINPTVLSQLNRLQRNLRGLPPLFEEEVTTSASNETETETRPTETETETETVNKKIVFDN